MGFKFADISDGRAIFPGETFERLIVLRRSGFRGENFSEGFCHCGARLPWHSVEWRMRSFQ